MRKTTLAKLPDYDWDFNESAEDSFVDWFHGDYGPFSIRSEYFYGDCGVQDKKTREDLMFKWIYVAFVTGFTRGISPLTRHNLPTE